MAAVAGVRSFNRTVSQRIGALRERYLARQRPLGEARLLWEIGGFGCALRDLRSRLGLDSGYLSRMLSSLEAAGLITVAAVCPTGGSGGSSHGPAEPNGTCWTGAATTSPARC